MPNITQLPIIEIASDQTYFLVVDNKIAKRFNINMLTTQLNKLVDPPLTSTSGGAVGQMAFDDRYIYICVSPNSWRRVASSTF